MPSEKLIGQPALSRVEVRYISAIREEHSQLRLQAGCDWNVPVPTEAVDCVQRGNRPSTTLPASTISTGRKTCSATLREGAFYAPCGGRCSTVARDLAHALSCCFSLLYVLATTGDCWTIRRRWRGYIRTRCSAVYKRETAV